MARHARRLIVWTTGVLLSLAVLAMLAFALLVWGIDPDRFRGSIERAATQALGRRVELTGPLRWKPGMNFQVESLGGRIANAEGFGSTSLASWQALRLGVQARPLLDRRLVIDRIEVEGLQLDLVRGATGVNWSLPPSGAQQQDAGLTLSIGSLRLRGGGIRFTDQVGGGAWSARDVELDTELPRRMDAPELSFTGIALRARLQGKPLDPAGVAMQLQAPRFDLTRAPLQVRIPDWTMAWGDARLGGMLQVDAGDAIAASGKLRVEAPSLRRLLQSVSVAAPATRDPAALGAMAFSADLQAGRNSASLSRISLELDSSRLQGDVTLPTLSPLALRFQLVADQVELDRYLTPEDQPGTPLTLPLDALHSLDAKGRITLRRATVAGAAAREMRIDVD